MPVLLEAKVKTRLTPGRQREPSSARDQRHHDDRPAQVVGRPKEPGHNFSNAEVRICKRSSTIEKHAATTMRVTSSARPPVNMIERDDEVQEFEPN